jgi:hypothetical protein
MVLNVPSAYLEEYAMVFEELFDVKLSLSQICRIFTKHGINRKKVFSFDFALKIASKGGKGT